MKKVILATALATAAAAAHARSDDLWFGTGLGWYEHPCGVAVFDAYGYIDTPEIRRAYQITKNHPELCSKYFPLP